MAEEQVASAAALTELRERLTHGLARARLTKKTLADAVDLSRTTVQEAFQADGRVPSAQTVAALARALRLPVEEMLDLRRTATGEARSTEAPEPGPGRPIGRWNPHDLEVHPAGPALVAELSGYVPRAHDRVLAEAVRHAGEGRSRMVVLVGSSSTGKTRACWEAVQPLAVDGWRLWHPFDPTRADAALADLQCVVPRTVVWLNEAQHYLGDPRLGEQIAAAVHGLVTDPARGPVLVLGTLWPEYAEQYTDLPRPHEPDPHSRARELLAGRTVTVAESFDQEALAAASALADGGDPLLADALTRARADGRVTQDLAGAPELLRRYETGAPAVRALIEAAMDARRLGVGLHLPQSFLIDAVPDYLDDHAYDELSDDWAEAAFADLARPVHGKQAPLRRTAPRRRHRPPGSAVSAPLSVAGPVFRLADYLEQHGRTARRHLCPPASFWAAAHTHLPQADDLVALAKAARRRMRVQWAHHLFHRATERGDTHAFMELAGMRMEAGDTEAAEALYQRGVDAGDRGALVFRARERDKQGDREGAEALYRRAAEGGDAFALVQLAGMRTEAGDTEAAEALYWRAVDAGHVTSLLTLAELRGAAGDAEGAEALYRRAADSADPLFLLQLAEARAKLAQANGRVANRDGVEVLYQRAADSGNPVGLALLARRRAQAGDEAGAEALHRQLLDTGDAEALVELAQERLRVGDVDGAEAMYRRATETGDTTSMILLAVMRTVAGDREGAEAQYRRAAEAGSTHALLELARSRWEDGDTEGAEALFQRAVTGGEMAVHVELARMREKSGDVEGAEAAYRRAADAGYAGTDEARRRWPHGLDPDGTPTPHWK
ncbi:hypothetical protein ACFYWX_12890 [Streptomyces sp. NPDC002888]|uniref:hypothetical protein n=1 Tax=Streptomyces sp. NPDC002888 TaxID=3364668 RepID=UPI0036C921FC